MRSASACTPAREVDSGRTRENPRVGTEIEEVDVADSVYKVVELVGTSTESWEKAASAAVEKASQSLRDLRIAEVDKLDLQIDDGRVSAFRAKVKLSFKYED